jgi:hypothetical protein
MEEISIIKTIEGRITQLKDIEEEFISHYQMVFQYHMLSEKHSVVM